jgi:hypothetical protein
MSRDYFSILGLTPGRYEPSEITRHFNARRRWLITALDSPARHVEIRRQLNDLHLAYNALRDPRRQAECARAALGDEGDSDRVARLRRLIEASLEGGLLRCSRRKEILTQGRRMGFSEFHIHLLIAQVQFGGNLVVRPTTCRDSASSAAAARIGARFAAAGVLALALFLAMVRWLGA